MKRKLSILLISSVIAVSLAGCGSQSSESKPSAESIVSSSNSASQTTSDTEKTEETSGNSAIQTENTDNSTQNSEESTSSETVTSENPNEMKFVNTSEFTIDISDEVMAKSSASLEEPAVHILSSKADYDAFCNSYKEEYSLEKSDNGVTFMEKTADFDFDANSAVVVVIKHDKSSEAELGMIYSEGNTLNVEVYGDKPSSAENAAWNLVIATVSKSDVDGKTGITQFVSMAELEEEGDGTEVIAESEEVLE